MDALPTTHKPFYIHLASDATGTTLQGLARACLAQFNSVDHIERSWNLIRTPEQVDMMMDGIADEQGIVLMTIIDPAIRRHIREACRNMKIPCIPVLDPIMNGLSNHFGVEGLNLPGLQYKMDDAYFERIDALDFAMSHDDGQHMDGLDNADIILVGVSRTSKTPTSVYLANRGLKTANIPLVPSVNIDESFLTFQKPLYIGLTESSSRLLDTRRNRLLDENNSTDAAAYRDNAYLDEESIKDEIKSARKLFAKHEWPIIDVTKRSIEETASEIISIYTRDKAKKTKQILS